VADLSPAERWPALPAAERRDTRATLHLWTKVICKIRLALTPWLNHSWHVALSVRPGLHARLLRPGLRQPVLADSLGRA